MDVAIQSGQSELDTLQRRCITDLSRLSLWEGAFEDLPGLEVPNREGISHFEGAYDQLEQRSKRLEEKCQEARDTLQEASLELEKIEGVGEVPAEKDLDEARSGRDQVWQLLRRQWIDGEDVATEVSHLDLDETLPDVFEGRLIGADELSDRLRREADRVHAIADLKARQRFGREKERELAERLEACRVEKNQVDIEWQALWTPCAVLPRTPREMRAWLGELEKLRDQVEQLNLFRDKVGDIEQTRKAHMQLLNKQLEALGRGEAKSKALETVLLECEEFAQELDDTRQKCDLLNKEVKALGADLKSLNDDHQLAKEQLDVWKGQWKALVESYGLVADSSPVEVANFIEKVRELFTKQGDIEKLRIRINSIDDDALSFGDQVSKIMMSLAPDLAGLATDDAVTRINTLLSDHRSRNTRRKQIAEQLEQLGQEIRESKSVIEHMRDQLDSCCLEAKCDKHADLEEAERESAQYLKVTTGIELIEQEILDTGDGISVAKFEVETEGLDPDGLPGRIEELNNKIDDELEPKRTDLAQAKGREQKELELMDGSDDAAELGDQVQAILASIRSDSERYVRVKLAGWILRDEIERYRKENQGPLIERASEYFRALTLGSFSELMTGFNEKDAPVLEGIRPDGLRVKVEGMSTGTRDQLYLALRIASLEKYMESAEPMPFIVDDVLVDFDDSRSEAALNALSGLAEKTQVILFTHHRQVMEQAKNLQAAVCVHELGNAG